MEIFLASCKTSNVFVAIFVWLNELNQCESLESKNDAYVRDTTWEYAGPFAFTLRYLGFINKQTKTRSTSKLVSTICQCLELTPLNFPANH